MSDMHATAGHLRNVQVLIFNGIPEMSIAIEVLPTYVKQVRGLHSCLLPLCPTQPQPHPACVTQRDNMFYRARSYVLPVTIMRLPCELAVFLPCR